MDYLCEVRCECEVKGEVGTGARCKIEEARRRHHHPGRFSPVASECHRFYVSPDDLFVQRLSLVELRVYSGIGWASSGCSSSQPKSKIIIKFHYFFFCLTRISSTSHPDISGILSRSSSTHVIHAYAFAPKIILPCFSM
jgi:hypothetical protein